VRCTVFSYILSFAGVDFPSKGENTKASSCSIVFNTLKNKFDFDCYFDLSCRLFLIINNFLTKNL